MRSERLCKDLALVFENVPFVVNHKRKRLCRSNGRLFHIVVVSRSKAVWINFHGKQLSKRKEFEWNLANLPIHAHIYRFMQIWKNPHKTWLNKQIRQQLRGQLATFVSNIHSVGSFGADISIRSGGLLITPQANAALPHPTQNVPRKMKTLWFLFFLLMQNFEFLDKEWKFNLICAHAKFCKKGKAISA